MKSEVKVVRNYNAGRLVVSYEKGILSEYQKKVLASGEVRNFVKMEFINIHGSDVVNYCIEGLEVLSEYKVLSFNNAMDFLEMVLHALMKSEEYLVDIGNICLDPDHIYIEPTNNLIKFFYKPSKEPSYWLKSFRGLVVRINDAYENRDINVYFEKLTNYIDENSKTLEDLSLKISELKRDAHICGIR